MIPVSTTSKQLRFAGLRQSWIRLSTRLLINACAFTTACSCTHHCIQPPVAQPFALTLPADLPGISGLARLSDRIYVVVLDTKGKSVASPLTDRLGAITIDSQGTVAYTPISLAVSRQDLPQDLEAITPVPGFTDRFYILESGGNGSARRLFTCTITAGIQGSYAATLVGPPLNLRSHTATLSNVESLLAVPMPDDPQPTSGKAASRVMLVLADRIAHKQAISPVPNDPEKHGPSNTQAIPAEAGTLRLVSLTLSDGEVIESDEWVAAAPDTDALRADPSGTPPDPGAAARDDSSQSVRVCSDLFFGPDQHVYMSSCFDGGLRGPFNSTITRIGMFDGPRFVPDHLMSTISIPGHKIEAISMMPATDGSWTLVVGADDESLGGYLQLMPPPTGAPDVKHP